MGNIARRQNLARHDRFSCLPDQNAIHDYLAAWCEVLGGELVFRQDVGCQHQRTIQKRNLISLPEVAKSDQDVVPGIELQDSSLHGNYLLTAAGFARSKRLRLPLQAYSKRLSKLQDNKSILQILVTAV